MGIYSCNFLGTQIQWSSLSIPENLDGGCATQSWVEGLQTWVRAAPSIEVPNPQGLRTFSFDIIAHNKMDIPAQSSGRENPPLAPPFSFAETSSGLEDKTPTLARLSFHAKSINSKL